MNYSEQIKIERAKETARLKQVQEKMIEIAKYFEGAEILAEPVTDETYNARVEVKGEDYHFRMVNGTWTKSKEKINVSAVYPRSKKGEIITALGWQEQGPESNFSHSRPAPHCANVIKDRFFPQHKPHYAKIQERLAQDNSYYDKTWDTLKELKGAELTEWERSEYKIYTHCDACRTLKVSRNDVYMDLTVTKEQAKYILKYLENLTTTKA